LFLSTTPACDPGSKTILRFQTRLHPRLSRYVLIKLASAPFCCFLLSDVFLLIRRSHFSRQFRSRFRLLPGSPGLRGLHPSRQRYPMLSVSLLSALRPARAPGIASARLLWLFFSASAKMKEKNQSSNEGQEKSS
jgi:hypothetical protein